jgi:uncharacterized protein (TIGR03086 family)
MTLQELFTLAEQTFTARVELLKAEDWDKPVTADQTVRQLVAAHAKDVACVPGILAKRANTKVRIDGDDLLGEHPKQHWVKLSAAAQEAVNQVSDLSIVVKASYGRVTARDYLLQTACYRTLQAWDLAKATGLDTELPEPLMDCLWESVEPVAGAWRSKGVFGPALPMTDSGDSQTRFLALAGRRG